jgi:hypothetical protein
VFCLALGHYPIVAHLGYIPTWEQAEIVRQNCDDRPELLHLNGGQIKANSVMITGEGEAKMTKPKHIKELEQIWFVWAIYKGTPIRAKQFLDQDSAESQAHKWAKETAAQVYIKSVFQDKNAPPLFSRHNNNRK